MRYLPSKMVSEPFWAQLLPKIARLLKKTRVLRPWSGGPLKPLSQLKRVPAYFLDEAGDPMFEDMIDKTYLSAGYTDVDFKLLEGLGVGELSFENILTRIRADLKDPFSRWKSSGTSDDWITRSSSMLMRPFTTMENTADAVQVRALPLIPLYDGSWVSSDTGPVFRSHNDGIQVPTDLGLRLIDRRARRSPARLDLFKELGLRYCYPNKVIALILEKYNAWNDIRLHYSVSHIRYMYRYFPENEGKLPRTVHLRDQELRPVYRELFVTCARKAVVDDLYFKTDDEYGPGELLKALPQSSDGTTISAPGFPVHFINSAYLKAEPPVSYHHKLTWEEWLHSCAKVRRVPRLSSEYRTSELSKLFTYVIESRSDKLVGTLKAHWSSYEALMNPEIVSTLSKAVVPCENGESKRLQETVLPLPSLRRISRMRGIPQSLPFLRLPFELKEGEQHDWTFLKIFGVICQQNISFRLECLRHLVRADQESEDMSRRSLSNLIEIYEAIEEHGSESSYEQIKYVLSLTSLFVLHPHLTSCRKLFQDEFAIYVPADGIDPEKWTCPSQTVWKAPSFLDVHCPLAGLEMYRANEKIRNLFNEILGVENACWSHYITQLEAESERNNHLGDMAEIYRHIYRDESADKDWESVR